VAGLFYPGDPEELAATVDRVLEPAADDEPPPKALIAPHAGYVYSGPVAGRAYTRLRRARDTVTRVVLVGPAHRAWIAGLAVSGADGFATPLGTVPIDAAGRAVSLELPWVVLDDTAHAAEHSLEVHLPFLQRVLARFAIVPLVVGDADPAAVAAVLEHLWGGPETCIVASTDLSHYHDHATAQALDAHTARCIVARAVERIGDADACGARPVRGLLEVARRRDLPVRLLDLRTSGDTAGSRDEVVGYGAFAVG
jgi:AmmeMemoRadiSam system protein B